MSSGHNKGSGHHRKAGDWKAIANGRNGKVRTPARTVNPMMAAPKLADVSSAACRRRLSK